MKTYLTFCYFFVITVFLLGCHAKSKADYAQAPAMEARMEKDIRTVPETPILDSIQQETPEKQQEKPINTQNNKGEIALKDTLADIALPQKKFIKTAELRGKVKNTIQLTELTENIIKNYGGFVTHAKLQNYGNYTNTVTMSSDSLLHITHIRPGATLMVAVPYQHLDSVMRKIARLLEVVEERKVTAEDVSISLLEEKMKATVNQQSKVRLQKATQEAGNRLDRIVEAEEAITNRQLAVIESQVTNLRLHDRILYSSITIEVTQPEIIKQYTTYNNNTSLKSPFLYRLQEAFVNGWEMTQHIVLFLIEGWAVWLVILIFIFLYRRFAMPFFRNRKITKEVKKED